jgi:hypothetical protein
VVALLTGLFHQPHQAPMMYALLGMGFAFARRYRPPAYLISRRDLFPAVVSDKASRDRDPVGKRSA